MWIRNTSRHADREVRRLVEFATADVDMSGVCVNVRNGHLAGGAYNGIPSISNAPENAEYLITLRIGTGRETWPLGPVNYHFKSPQEVGPRNRFPFFVCHDWREWLVKLAAHEAHHINQFRNDETCSEIACERFAVELLARYRRERGVPAPQPVKQGRPPLSRRARLSGWGDAPAAKNASDLPSPQDEQGQLELFRP